MNTGRSAVLYVSHDADSWQPAASYRKDPWPFGFFQYGTLVLPYSSEAGDVAMYSGQAVHPLDGRLRIFDLHAA